MTTFFISNSSLSTLLCPARFGYRQGWQLAEGGKDLAPEFGKAFHDCMKEHAHGREWMPIVTAYRPIYEAIHGTTNDFLTPAYLAQIVMEYTKIPQPAPLAGPAGPLVEAQFTIPIYKTDQTEVMLKGTIDRLEYDEEANAITIVDYKTTSTYGNPEAFLSSFLLSSQFTVYARALQWLRDNSAGMPERLRSATIQCQVRAVFLSKTRPFSFVDGPIFRPNQPVGFFEDITSRVARCVHQFEQGTWAEATNGTAWGLCAGKYKPCPYAILCRSSATAREALRNLYTVKPFDPHDY